MKPNPNHIKLRRKNTKNLFLNIADRHHLLSANSRPIIAFMLMEEN